MRKRKFRIHYMEISHVLIRQLEKKPLADQRMYVPQYLPRLWMEVYVLKRENTYALLARSLGT